ncbi:HdeD family acid-resistance protein [Aquamicrobium sp. LC103]|uniref:HdeD family acid-resistance protein n=1 Tax=Aquamicrobium sp. LC103 TaxID=1120658 RepID=UPI00063EB7D4|nr:HdeD family acid-resistance protein [Aquamicrobium sp. LC103]TKT79368.1 HdeD family acid-resistance protein [Aquamicrobium sp. LC103]
MAITEQASKLRGSWIWMALFAVICLIGGVIALLNPFAATLAATFIAGWTFAFLGALQIIQSFQVKDWPGFVWAILFGILTLVVGISLITNPLAGMISLTLLVAVLFLVMGIVKIMYAFSLRPISGWGWALASGVISLALAAMIFANLPEAAASVLGILLAVELISNGVLFMLLALGFRKI